MKEGIYLFEKSDVLDRLIYLGNIHLFKENKKNRSYCCQIETYFNYHGIEKALNGKTGTWYSGERFTPKRILVIQMK